MSDEQRPRTTNDSGIPAPSDEFSLTVGPAGPNVLHDHYVVQKMQHFNRERVPERVVHAKGGGAHGFFEVTEDVSQFTKADFLSGVGKQTPVFLRFSTVAGEQGFADTVRDPRGFAIKFYTQEGNYDLVGNNTPVFFVRDPSKFQDFIHSQKRLPDTGLRSQRDAVGLLDALARERAPGDDPDVRPRHPGHLAPPARLLQPHVTRGSTPAASASGSSTTSRPLQGIENLTEEEAGQAGRRGPGLPPARPVQHDRGGRRAGVDARGAGDAVRGGGGLPLQPVRPHQGLAEGRLPADHGRAAGAGPQPGELLRRGRAGQLQPVQPRARHRPQPGPDADGPDLLLPRHPPAPGGAELRAAADQRAEGPRALLQQGRAHDLPARRRPAGVRAELVRRAAGRPGERRGPRLVGRVRRDRALRVRQARRGRRLRAAAGRCTAR